MVWNLRPHFFARDNIFVDMVKMLYQADTPTNVFPSLHVFNSVAACIAIYDSEALRKRRIISGASYVLAGSIVLATMFLKQHSIYDVIAAFVLAYALYQVVYVTEHKKVPKLERRKKSTVISK